MKNMLLETRGKIFVKYYQQVEQFYYLQLCGQQKISLIKYVDLAKGISKQSIERSVWFLLYILKCKRKREIEAVMF